MSCYLLVDRQFVNGGYFDTLVTNTLDGRVCMVTLQTKLGPKRFFISSHPNEEDLELAKNAFGDILRGEYFSKKEALTNILNTSYYRQYPPED